MKTLKDLKPAEYNPRIIEEKALNGLKTSIASFGDLSGITFNKKTGNLVSGHQRVKALQEKYGDLEIEKNLIKTPDGNEFKIRIVDWPIEKEKAANVAANNPRVAGEYTVDVLPILDEIKIEFPESFEELNFDGLLEDLNFDVPETEYEADCDEDEVPDEVETKEPITKRGDLWELGRHRLLCGDATMIDDVEKLMGGEKADMVFTDPPYGINVVKASAVGGGGAFGGKKNLKRGSIGGRGFIKANKYAPVKGDENTKVAEEMYSLLAALNIENIILVGRKLFYWILALF